jgi:cardiolipin synthase
MIYRLFAAAALLLLVACKHTAWRPVQDHFVSADHITVRYCDKLLQIQVRQDRERLLFMATWDQAELGTAELYEIDTERPCASRPVQLADADAWETTNRRILDDAVPEMPFTGVVVHGLGQDMVVYRNEEGRLQQRALADITEQIQVDHELTHQDLLLEAFEIEATAGPAYPYRLWPTGAAAVPYVFTDFASLEALFLVTSSNAQLAGDRFYKGLDFSWQSIRSVVIHSHLISLIKNPVTLASRFLKSVTATLYHFFPTPVSHVGPPAPLYTGAPMDNKAFDSYLQTLTKRPALGAKVKFLVDGQAYFTRLFQAINKAEKRINMQVYIFDTDDVAVRVADALRDRSKDVRVKVLMDDLGTLVAGQLPPDTPLPPGFNPPVAIGRYLRQDSRVRVRTTSNPWGTGDHTKRIIIDEKLAFVGGMNIGREYRSEWHDLMLEISGPLVTKLNYDFNLAWAHAGWGGDLLYFWRGLTGKRARTEIQNGYIPVRTLYTQTGKSEIFRAQLEAIERAKKRIWIQNAYISDNRILDGLVRARERGVDVRLILPSDNDSGVMHVSNRVTANTLIAHSARVFLYPGMTHLKAALFDDWACLGTANFDKMSFYMNQEINLASAHPEMVDALEQQVFLPDFEQSTEITEQQETSWQDYLIEYLANQY